MSTALLSNTELIAEEGGSPISINPFSGHTHLGIFASQGSGKTVLALDILTHALAADIPVFALDHPRFDGSSTLRDYTHALGGDYTDILFEGGNLFELTDLGCRDNLSDLLATTLQGMIVGNSDDPYLITHCREILSLALRQFFDDPSIQERYTNAIEGGIGSEAWANTPTLRDFLPFCKADSLVVEGDSQKVAQTCEIITQRLTFWLNSHIEQAIASPSTKQTSSNLRVFAVREDSSPDSTIEQVALQLVALHFILRSAYLHQQSIIFIPKFSRLCTSPILSELIANLCTCGDKFGIRIILENRSIHPISDSSDGARTLQNLHTICLGQIDRPAAQTLTTVLGLPPSVLYRNTRHHFVQHRQGSYSKWLVVQNGTHILARHYASEALLKFSSS